MFLCYLYIEERERESVGMTTVMNIKYNSVVNNDSIKPSLLFIIEWMYVVKILSEQSCIHVYTYM